MAVFIISYDLRKPDFDYKPLYSALAGIDAKRLQDSVWGVRTEYSADVIWEHLWKCMHSGKDRLFVVTFNPSLNYQSKNAISLLKDL